MKKITEHVMLKEILEQDQVIRDIVKKYVDFDKGIAHFEEFKYKLREFRKVNRVTFLGCGTSYHSAIYGNYIFLVGSGYIDIISVVDPYNPVSSGIIGEKEPGSLMITLRIEAVDLLNIKNGELYSDRIARFGISSLDTLNKKYGVFEISQLNQYYPRITSSSAEDIENYTPTICTV